MGMLQRGRHPHQGEDGTLDEFMIACDMGKAIGVLKGSGGIAGSVPLLVEMLNEPSDSAFVHSEVPMGLVGSIERAERISRRGGSRGRIMS